MKDIGFYIALGGAMLFGIIITLIVIHQDYREKHPKAV